jgi:hypothetical protein
MRPSATSVRGRELLVGSAGSEARARVPLQALPAVHAGGFFLSSWGVECLLSALDLRFNFHIRSSSLRPHTLVAEGPHTLVA